MKKHIAEELPARKHAPAAAPVGDAKGGKDEKSPEKRIRQAVYDIRYRARREDVPLRTAFAQYMQNSTLSANERTAVKAKLFGDGPMKTEEFVASAKELASESVSNALVKVFVGEEIGTPKKYKVRVEDKNGKSYVRYADRAKITELRLNPNIRSVEITSYGEPYEGERKKGSQTAAAKAGKDYDGDGKVESGAKEYRGAVHNAIQRRRGGTPDGKDTSSVKEDFIADLSVSEEKKTKLDILPKDQINVVKVHTGKNDKSLGEATMTSAEKEEEKKLKKKYDKSGMKASMKKQYGEEGKNIYFATIRKKAMQTAGFEPEGDVIDEYAKGGGGSAPNIPGAAEFIEELPKKVTAAAKKVKKVVTGESVEAGPILPGEKGKRVFPSGQEPKRTGAKLPPLQNAGFEPEGESIQEADKVMSGIVDRFREKIKEREAQGKDAEKFSASTCGCGKFPCECDDRSRKTSMDLYKNKLRAMGLKMDYEPEGEQIDEYAGLLARGILAAGTALAGKAVYDKGKKVADKIKTQNDEKAKQIDTLLQRNSFEPEGEVIDEAKYGTAKGRKALAKKVRAGKDVGKKGAGFEAIVDKASPKVGKKRATKIAAAAMWKNLANSYEPEGETVDERYDEPGERRYGREYDRFRRPGPEEGKDFGGSREEKPIDMEGLRGGWMKKASKKNKTTDSKTA